jgi:hypothetical protein
MPSNLAKFSASRLNSCTVDMPVMFSCRNALMRAIQARTVRYDSRTFRRNHWVTSRMSGSTENATSASRQSMTTSIAMMPTSVNMSPNAATTPDVNRSLRTSTSVVTRVISRPTGLRS